MTPTPQKRRSTDPQWPTHIAAGVKTAFTFICLGVLGFVGSWGIDLTKTTARLREDVEVLKEKERMMVEQVYPQFMQQVGELKSELREIKNDLRQLNNDLRRKR